MCVCVCVCVCCFEGYCYLKSIDVMKLLLDVLCDTAKCDVYGPELTAVILKDVLSIRASWFSLNALVCNGNSV